MTTPRRQSSRRAKRSRKRLDLSPMKEALKDGRLFPCLAKVTVDDDSGSHFDLDGEDLFIECEMIPNAERVSARMGVVGGGAGQGIWFISPPDSEVMLLIPDGELEAGPILVAVLSTGSLPSGIAEGVTIIANSSKVLIHDGAVGAEPLVLKSAYEVHTHGSGVGPTTPPDNAAAPTSYTAILEAK